MYMEQAPAPDSQRVMSQEEKLARARRQVAALKAFYIHLFAFVAVILLLAIINAATGGPWWVLWVLLGWGIGVLAHGLFVFAGTSRRVAEWEQRKVRELADRM
jgi:fatty acid desaturase